MSASAEEMEREASLFAMHLLVPTEMLRSEVRKMGGIELCGDGQQLKKLAKRFGVSQEIIAFRIGEEAGRLWRR